MANVRRRLIAFPGPADAAATQTVNTLVAAAVPGPGAGQAGQFAFDAKTSPSLAPAVIIPQTKKILLPQTGPDGPVSAIGIAPDSAIHSAYVALHGDHGEMERYLISPGNPLVGISKDVDFALITLPNMPPAIQIVQLVTHVDVLWDSPVQVLPSVGAIGGWPLRLEIWRGCPLPMRHHQRALYSARARLLIQDSGAGEGSDDASFYVCVDGRRKVDVIVSAPDTVKSDPFVVSMATIEPVYNANGANIDTYVAVPLVLDNVGNTSQSIASTTPAVFSFDGNPMTLLRVNCAITAGGGAKACIAHVTVRAWD